MSDKIEGQGKIVFLPNKEKRVDFIRNRYYNDGVSRSDIRKEVNEMLEKAGREDDQIPYQIVFAATKTEEDPRIAQAERAEAKAKVKAEKEAAKEAEKAKAKK